MSDEPASTPLGEKALAALAEMLERPRSDIESGVSYTRAHDGVTVLSVRLRPELATVQVTVTAADDEDESECSP